MGYERTHSFQKKSKYTPQPTTQFSTRPLAAPVQRKPHEHKTPDELENEAFNHNKFEAFGLQLKEKSGTITPVEQERLGVLQAKMDDFWAQRRERASLMSNDYTKIPVHPPEGQATPQLQPMWRQGTPGVPMEEERSHLNSPQPSSASPIQAKLTIGEPGDKYEQEADQVASQVVEQINVPASAQSPQGQSVQRQEEKTEELQRQPEITALQRQEEKTEELQAKSILQRREAIAGGEATNDLDTAINSARGSGQPLDAGLQRSMGQAMGADFSGVRVHTDAQSNQLNQSIQAKAFTTGQDVFFRQGAYEPGSRGGQELIAHELTHVVQQNTVIRPDTATLQPVVQRKLANNQNELSNTDLPVSDIPNPATTNSGPYPVPSSVTTRLGQFRWGQEPDNGGPLWNAVSIRNKQGLALPDEAIYDRAHIVANVFGGSGNFPNIVPTTAHFNRNQMWPQTELPLHQARQTGRNRAFQYQVNVDYNLHPYSQNNGMMIAETFLPTGFRFHIDEYTFNGGGAESTNWANWTLSGGTNAFGSSINYSNNINHAPNFAAFPAYRINAFANWGNMTQQQKTIWIQNNRVAINRNQFEEEADTAYTRDYLIPQTNNILIRYDQLAQAHFEALTVPANQADLNRLRANALQIYGSAITYHNNLPNDPGLRGQATTIAIRAQAVADLIQAMVAGQVAYNGHTLNASVVNLQQALEANPLPLLQ